MNAIITDEQVLSSVGVIEMMAYLRANGWAEHDRPNRYAARWRRPDEGRSPSILLPLDTEIDDFAGRVADILAALSDVEKRSQLELLTDILAAHADLLRIPLWPADEAEGTIPIEDGALAFDRAKELMIAAAKRADASAPRRVYASKRSANFEEYIRTVRLGQTERGSYVLTILSPVARVLQQNLFDEDEFVELEDPFGRKVTKTLARALSALPGAAQRAMSSKDMTPFDEAVEAGVSANLCAGVLGLMARNGAKGLHVRFQWSPARPVRAGIPSVVHIPHDSAPLIAEAERHFRDLEPREDFAVEGLIINLHRAHDDLFGKVTIRSFVDGAWRQVVMELAGTDYGLAVDAHRDRLPVACTGTLVKEGRSFELRGPDGLVLIRAD